jgi:hypothetical protein
LTKLNEVTVLLVVDLDDTPRVGTTADLATIGASDLVVGTNDSERNLGHDLVVLGDCLLIVELISRTLEDLDTVVFNIGEDLNRSVIVILPTVSEDLLET